MLGSSLVSGGATSMLTDNGGIILGKTNIMMRRALRWGLGYALGCVLLFALSGCGGLGGHFGGGGVDFTLSASPGSQAVNAGDFTTISVTINSTHGGLQIVRLSASGLPPGSTARFTDDVVTAPTTATLNILTGTNTPGGVSQITITGADLTGTQTTTASLSVTAAPPPPDFTLSAIPGTQLSLAGGTVSYGGKGNCVRGSP